MTKREIFLRAHEYAKKYAAIIGDYMVAIKLGLKIAYQAAKLAAHGCKVWERGIHRRMYINEVNVCCYGSFFGLKMGGASKSSHWFTDCTFDGERFANGRANRLIRMLDGAYLDLISGEVICGSKRYRTVRELICSIVY